MPIPRAPLTREWEETQKTPGGTTFHYQQSERLPTLWADDYDIAAAQLIDGRITDQQLFDNTIKRFEKSGYKAQLQDGVIVAQNQNGDSDIVDVGSALSDIYRVTQHQLKGIAETQPEIGTMKQRAVASLKASPMGKLNYIQGEYPNARVYPEIDDQGRMSGEFMIQLPGEKPRLFDDPSKFTAGDVADLAGDVVPTATQATGGYFGASIGAGAGPGGAGLGLITGGAIGGGVGEAGRQAISAFLPGKDEMSGKERALEIGYGALLGGGAEAAGIPIAGILRKAPQAARRVWGALPEAVPGAKSAADVAASKSMAEGIARTASKGSISEEMAETIRQSQWIQKRALRRGVEIGFTPAEASGSREELAIQRTIAQTPGGIDQMAKQRDKTLAAIGKFGDAVIEKIAADPSQLGLANVGKETADALDGLAKQAIKVRSESARPLYRAANEANMGRRVVPTDSTRSVMEEIDKITEWNEKANVGVKKFLKLIEEKGSKTSRITIEQAQNMRAFFGSIASGDQTVLEGLDSSFQRRIARKILGAIDDDLETAASSIQGKGAQLLREANDMWRTLSRPIDSLKTKSIMRMLRLDKEGSPEKIPGIIERMGSAERRGFFEIVDKSDPDLAKQIRAQMISNVLQRGGVNRMGSEYAKEVRKGMMKVPVQPGRLFAELDKNLDTIAELFPKSKGVREDLKAIAWAAERMSRTPGWGDSGTSANLINALTNAPIGTVGSQLAAAARKIVSQRLMTPEAMARAMTTREGQSNVAKMMLGLLEATEKKLTLTKLRTFVGAVDMLAAEEALAGVDQKPSVREQQKIQIQNPLVPLLERLSPGGALVPMLERLSPGGAK